MANTWKDIIITPENNSENDPKIVFRGANSDTNVAITLRIYPTSNGTLSFEGSEGQLFSITNDLQDLLWSVNDISGTPIAEAYANGDISMVPTSGNVFINGQITNSIKFTAGEAVETGNVCHLRADGKFYKTDADAEANADSLLVIATDSISADADGFFTYKGIFTTSGLTTGDLYYLSTDPGQITNTQPSVTGDIVRTVGYALSTTKLLFEPSITYTEVP